MRLEFVNPFVQAAREVLESETGQPGERGEVRVEKSAETTHEVTALVGVTGRVTGIVLYAMSEPTARAFVSQMMGEEVEEFDELAQSGISEMGNVITGRAAVLLAEAGFTSDINPPALLIGRGHPVTNTAATRLVVPLATDLGDLEIHMMLTESLQAAA